MTGTTADETFIDLVSRQGRRRFLGIGLAATGSVIAGSARAAEREGAQPAARPTYLAVYSRGAAWIEGQPLSGQQLRPHWRYMLELYRRGLLKSGGGFADDSGGAAVFEADDDAHAAALIAADPAVTARIFTCELRRWQLQPWERYA